MRNWIFNLLLLYCCLCAAPVYATDITSLRGAPLAVSADNEIINITGDGSVEVNNSNEALINNDSSLAGFVNTSIIVNTTLSSDGIIASGNSAAAVGFIGPNASLTTLEIDVGTVTSDFTSAVDGTVSVQGISATSPSIIVGKTAGDTATLSNTGVGGNAIYFADSNTINLSIENKATGTISSAGNAINLNDNTATSSLTLANAGTISAASGYAALLLDGYEATITNSGTISGNIIAINLTLSLTNTGTITGNVDLGSNAGSEVNLNAGTITGNVTMGNNAQSFIFNGGNIDGDISGAGTVRFDANTVLGGTIGGVSNVELVQISDGFNVSLGSNSYSIAANKIQIGASSSLTIKINQFPTTEFDGLSANSGKLHINLTDNDSDSAINSLLGSTNGLEELDISGTNSSVTIANSVKALTSVFSGSGNVVTLDASTTITGNVEIDDGSTFRLSNASVVTGTIQGAAQYKGTLVIFNPLTDGSVSSVTLNSDIGGSGNDLAALNANYATYIDAATNNVAIHAQNINLSSLSNLVLGTSTVTGTIKGHVDSGSNNGFGTVTFAGNNTLGGNVGTSNGNALNTVEINTGISVTAGNFEINALNINIAAFANLTTTGLISGGDNDDSGASLKNAAISLGDSGLSLDASLTLNADSSIYASIDGHGNLEINTTLNSTNSRLNIGGGTVLNRITLDDGATLDVSGNNGSVKADEILFGNGATLKLGNGEIVGHLIGNNNDDRGTLDIRGNVDLDNGVGTLWSLHNVNIGAVDDGGYSVTSHDSITATSVTINGADSLLSLDDGKSINSNVTIGAGAELSVGDASAVNGTISGDAKYDGTLTIRNASSFVAGGNIGAGGFDLSAIRVHGTFYLSDPANYEAHAQNFYLTNGASLIIGAGVIEGDIKGFGDGAGGVSHGAGKGSVSFAANIDPTNFLVSNIGTADGHAIDGLFVGENLIVNTGEANISAARITLYNGASLTSSASELTGGDQISGGLSRLATQITLNENASLTLNNVGNFIGTIDGNDYGQGNLTLTGSYIYNDGDDAIDIGATRKLASITLTNSSILDFSHHDGSVKANAITLNNEAVLTVRNSDIVGTVDGDAAEHGTLNLAEDVTLEGAVGATHKLLALNVGGADLSANVTANTSIDANNITIAGITFGRLTLAANAALTGDVRLDGAHVSLNLNNGSQVFGAIHGNAQYNGQLIILGNATSVVANNDIGAGNLDLSLTAINDAATFDLNTNDITLNSYSISMIDRSTLIVGSKSINAVEILGYDSLVPGSATHGVGKGSIVFAANNTLIGSIGNNTGNALHSITVNSGKTLDVGTNSIYSAGFTLQDNAKLNSSGIIGGGDNLAANAEIGTAVALGSGAILTLNDGATFRGSVLLNDSAKLVLNSGSAILGSVDGNGDHTGTLEIGTGATINSNFAIGNSSLFSTVNIGASATLDLSVNNNILKADTINLGNASFLTFGSGAFSGAIDGAAANKGTVNIAAARSLTNITLGGANGLLAVNFGNNAGANFDVNSIKATTVTIIGSASQLNLANNQTIDGNVVLNGDAAVSLGDGSAINGSITNLSDSTANGAVVIRNNALVTTNGNIGGGGFNFYGVQLKNNSQLDLSAHNNSISALFVRLSSEATLKIGSATVAAEIQAYNSDGGSNYGLGNVVFADNNTIGSNVGSESGATLANVTINAGKNVDANSQRIAALQVVIEDGAILRNSGSINAGTATEGGDIELSSILIGADGTLSLSAITGESINAYISGNNSDNEGKLQIASGTITAYAGIGYYNSLAEVNLAAGTGLDLASNNITLKASEVNLGNGATLTVGTARVTADIYGVSNGLGSVSFNGASNVLAGKVGGHNDNALANVTINTANAVTAGSHEINASTITLNSYATLTTSGTISGGADVTGVTPIATAISLHGNSSIILNAGASIFGTIDGAESTADGMGTIEVAANYTTNGNIGATHKLTSVIVNDGFTLDLGTNSNSLNAKTVYLGDAATLSLGDAGTVNAAIASLTADSGVLYFNNSITLDSGSTLGGDTGLLSIYVDHAAAGSVVVDSNDSIKAKNINITGLNSELSMAANTTITGNVNLGSGSKLSLDDGASVVGSINGNVDDSNGRGSVSIISGTVTLNGNLGEVHKLASLNIEDGANFTNSSDSGIINAAAITVGTGSTLSMYNISGSGSGDFGLNGNVDGAGTVNLSVAGGAYDLNAVLGATSTLSAVNITSSFNTLTIKNSIQADTLNFNSSGGLSVLRLDNSKNISGDVVLGSGTVLNLKNNSFIGGSIEAANDNSGSLIVGANVFGSGGTAVSAVAHSQIGATDKKLALIKLNDNATFDLATHAIDAKTYDASIGVNSTLEIGGGSFSAADMLTLNNSASITIDDGSLSFDTISMASNSSITIGSGTINGDVNGGGHGLVTVTGDFTANGKLGTNDLHNAQLYSLTIADGASLITGHEISALTIDVGEGGTLTTSEAISGGFDGTDIFTSEMTLGVDAIAQFNNSPFIITNINGNEEGDGEIDIFGSIAGKVNIGEFAKIKLITIDNDSSLDVATHNTNANATNIKLAYSGALIVGSTTLNSAIDGNRNDYGQFIVASDKATIMNGDIGATHYLNDVEISSGASLDLASNGNSLNSTTTRLANGAILNVGSGAISGNFVSSESFAAGTINFRADKTIGSGVALLGTNSSSLENVTIVNGANLTVSNSIYANQINIGTTGATATSLTMNVSSTKVINGNVAIANRANLTINLNGILTTQAIYGASDGVGTLNVLGNGTMTLHGNIGATNHALSAFSVGLNSFINATGGQSIIANDIYLSSGSGISISSGSIIGDVHGGGDGGSLYFDSEDAHTLQGNLGSTSDDVAIEHIEIAGLLNAGSHSINVGNFHFNSTNSALTIGSGRVDIASFTNENAGSGVINFSASNNLNFAIDSDNEIAALNIANGATVNVNQNVAATSTAIGTGTSGKLILAASKIIDSNVTINSGGNLTLQNGAQISGNILGASSLGGGTFELAASASVAAAGNVGSSSNKLSAITINNGAALNLGAHNLVASNVSLGSGSTLTIGSGTFSALVAGSSSGGSGNGTINFTSDRALAQNIGTSSHKVATVGVGANQTLQTGANAIYANNISLANGATFELQDGAFISNQINGDSLGHGNINASGTVTLNAIGSNHAVNNITTATNSNITFGGNINAAGDVNINGSAIFSNTTTNITANSFNINSGATLSLSLNLSSPATSLEIAGGAIISANTHLNLTISGSAASGTSFTLVNASAASTIAAISGAQINVNNSGSNVVRGQTYTTAVSGNQLVLTLTGEAIAPIVTFPSENSQKAYEAIIGISNPTGALGVVQDYLNSAASVAQKEEVVKSVTAQTDNATNRVDFNNITTTANIISARLESLYNDVNIINSGPSFTLNNNGTNSQAAWAQTLEPLRDNNTKPAYPVSLALNDPQEKGAQAAWIQTFGSNVNQKTTNDGDGYKANSGGVSVGFDCKKCADFIVGASASYTQSNISNKGSAKNLNIDSYQVSVYTGHSTKSYFLNTSLGFALNNYNSTRQIAIAGVSAKGAYSGNSYTARVEIGSNYKFANETILTPSLTLTAARNTYESYNESGAGTLNLHVKNDSSNFFEGRIGAELSRLFLTKNDSKIRPQFSLSYGYDFIGDEQRTNSNFIGQTTSFTSEGAKVAQGSLKIGTGVALYTKNDITFGINYSFEHRESYTSNSGWMRVRYGF